MFTIIQGKGQECQKVTLNDGDIVLNAGDIVYTDAISDLNHDNFCVSYQVKSDGIPNIKIDLEECDHEPKQNESDETCSVANGVKPIDYGVIDTLQHHARINPLPLKCFRFRLEQLSTTCARCVVDMSVSCK